MCFYAGVSRSGYYTWLNNKNTEKQELKDQEDFNLILKAYKFRGYDKGVNGIYMRLKRMNVTFNKKKIRRLMRKFGLNCPIRKPNPYKRMLKSMGTDNYADNILNREFTLYGPRYVLLTDITYFFYGQSKTKAYLSVIKDAYTKEILSYVLSDNLKVDFVIETVRKLIRKHKKELNTNCLIHSDQGSHYTSYKFIDILKKSKIRQSMSRRGNCWDNAPQESFFGHMKDELHLKECLDYEDLLNEIDDYMDYYNNYRYQWDLGKRSPIEYRIYLLEGGNPLLHKKEANCESTQLASV